MTEFLLAFCAGYITGRLLAAIAIKKPDVMLKWNEDALGWRPITSFKNLDSKHRYIVGTEVPPDAIAKISSLYEDK